MKPTMSRRSFITALSASAAGLALASRIRPSMAAIASASGDMAMGPDLIAAAEKEGKVVVYGDLFTVQIIVKGFNQHYPKIDVTTATGDAWQIYNRFVGEQQAGRPVMDVFWQAEDTIVTASAAGTLAPIAFSERSVLLPMASAHGYKTYLRGTGQLCIPAYNKSAIGSVPPPTDWTDFKTPNPAWGQLIATTNPASSSATFAVIASLYQQFGPTAGGEILQGLHKINAELAPSMGVMATKMQTGERPIDFFNNTTAVSQLTKQGVPIQLVFPKSGSVAQYNAVAVSKTAPHPNASRLFVEYALGKEAQTALAGSGAYPVRTDVAPPSGLPPLATTKLLALDMQQALKDRETILKWWASNTGFIYH